MIRPPPTYTLFPYTTLFRSGNTRSQSRTPAAARIGSGVRGSRSTNRNFGDGGQFGRGRFFRRGFFVLDRKSTRLNSSHVAISYAVFCLKKKKQNQKTHKPAT